MQVLDPAGMLAAGGLFAVWDTIWPYLAMLAGFSVIVFVHELGHFLVAKWADVKVERFAVGFGREIIGFTRGETRYSFNVLPFGGYVKMLGQEDFDDKGKELQFNSDPRSFVNKPVGHRMAIVSAGVVMNVLFAALLFMIVFMVGRQATSTRIALVEPDSPAEQAGILPGDIIREINGDKILEFQEVRMAVLLAPLHQPIDLVVERDGGLKTFSVEPKYPEPENTRDFRRQIIGFTPGVTREIAAVGPEIDTSREDMPHVGDLIVEVDDHEVTDENASELIHLIPYARSVVVERKNEGGQTRRLEVDVPPILSLYPSGPKGNENPNVLGLSPLMRFSHVDPRGRAYLAGLRAGDTVLSWDDIDWPNRRHIHRAIRDRAEYDIPFRVRKSDGREVSGYVRPERHKGGASTIQASFEWDEDKGVRIAQVRRAGIADRAGLAVGDVITRIQNESDPTLADVEREVRKGHGRVLQLEVQSGGSRRVVMLETAAPGSINAGISLVAHDVLRIGGVVPTIDGRPSPAAVANLPSGALITTVAGAPVSTWRELIDTFVARAGSTVDIRYETTGGESRTAQFTVPRSLRTVLGVGPAARIISIDGKKTILMETRRGQEEVSIGYRLGMRKLLGELVGRQDVEVTFRRTPMAPLETARVAVTEDMLDPWLGRVSFEANLVPMPEMKLLKGENAWEAIEIGVHKTWYFIRQVYTMLQRMIFSRSVEFKSISGPLGIIDIGGKVARLGWTDFLFFLGLISANLAVINFLPLPIVDGGLMVFLIIEKIKGCPVSLKVQTATQMIGIVLIIGLFILVTFNDAVRMWG